MVQISNNDARIILTLLERGQDFYRNHATKLCHVNDGRRMAVMAKKIRTKVNCAAATPRPQTKKHNDKETTD